AGWPGIPIRHGGICSRAGASGCPTRRRSSGAALTPATRLALAVIAARLVRDIMRLCLPLERRYAPYHGRPFVVVHAERFAIALHETVTDPVLRRLPRTGGVGQWADSTGLLQRPA